jgi:hypothetical protein
MYVLYYALILQCWHLVWMLVRTDHPWLGVGCHNALIMPETHIVMSFLIFRLTLSLVLCLTLLLIFFASVRSWT